MGALLQGHCTLIRQIYSGENFQKSCSAPTKEKTLSTRQSWLSERGQFAHQGTTLFICSQPAITVENQLFLCVLIRHHNLVEMQRREVIAVVVMQTDFRDAADVTNVYLSEVPQTEQLGRETYSVQ